MKIHLFGKELEIRKEYLAMGIFLMLVLLTLWGWHLQTNQVEVFDAGDAPAGQGIQTSLLGNKALSSALTGEKQTKEELQQFDQSSQNNPSKTEQEKALKTGQLNSSAATQEQYEEKGQTEASQSKQANQKQSTPQTPLININTATIEELVTLYGIGEVKAKAIITYRQQNGSFQTIDEIKNVKGIGEVTFEKLKDSITVQ